MFLIADGGICSCNISNTIDAIMLSKNINYIDGVKLDVRMSKDNVLVLSEYDDLRKETSSQKKISEENYHYLRRIKFPSHVFKYFIPTLDEVLKDYNNSKIMLLELYSCNNDDKYLEELYHLLKKYRYKYYFLSESPILQREIQNSKLLEIGEFLDANDYQKVDSFNKIKDSLFIISKYPEKIHKKKLYYDNNFLF